jgi:DNA repair photolyase
MKYYQAPRWTYEFLDCSMPMTFDTYNKCSGNCLYCFSYFQKSHSMGKGGVRTGKHDYQSDTPLTWVDVEKIKKLFRGEIKKGPLAEFNSYIAQRKFMQWGGLADQFDGYERQKGITLELLKFFKEINYPLSFSTKQTWFTKDERYMSLIRGQKNWHFKFSIINLDPELSAKIEKGIDSPQERLAAMKRIAEAGVCGTTLRLRPFIIGMSDKNDDYLELIKKAKEAGADSVSTEFFCLETRMDSRLRERFLEMSKALGFNLIDFYKKYTPKAAGYLRLNYNTKKPYIEKMKALCDNLGMRFYVSDAHHKEKCHNGSCCGLAPECNYSRGQFTNALMIAREKGKVYWKDIEPEAREIFENAPLIGNINYSQLNYQIGRKHLSLLDAMREKWNNPKSKLSPYQYFGGILYPIGLDEENNVIYEYRPK